MTLDALRGVVSQLGLVRRRSEPLFGLPREGPVGRQRRDPIPMQRCPPPEGPRPVSRHSNVVLLARLASCGRDGFAGGMRRCTAFMGARQMADEPVKRSPGC